MSGTRFLFLTAVHAFFVKDDKVLLLERANTGYRDGFFSVPAGHVDGGETMWSAMIREAKEEVGITLTEVRSPSHVMHRVISPTEERIDFFFIIDTWIGEPINCEKHKCAQLMWADSKNLPDNTIPYIKHALREIRQGRVFSEFDET